MNLEDIRTKGNRFSKTATELNQKLCFAGIAIIWILKSPIDETDYFNLPIILVYGLLAFALSLLIEMLYSSASARIWERKYHHYRINLTSAEKKLQESKIERKPPGSENIPWAVFFFKIAITTVGYITIILQISKIIAVS